MVFLTHVIIPLLVRQHLREWILMKYIPAMITRLNCSCKRKSLQENPPGECGKWYNDKCQSMCGVVCVVCVGCLNTSVCACLLWHSGCYRTSLHTDTYSCIVETRRYLISCTSSDWLLFFISLLPSLPSSLLSYIFRLWGRGEDETSQPSADPAVHHAVQECKGGL